MKPDQFYTGLIAHAYAPLRGSPTTVEPYARFVRKHGTPALELGCGHGEPLLDLIADGFDVDGLDSSADMLELCRAEAVRRGLKVELFCMPMESMKLERRYQSIFLAGPTFQLIIDETLAQRALANIAEHLIADGRALVPLFVPEASDPRVFGVWREHTEASGDTVAVRMVDESRRATERRIDRTLEYRRTRLDGTTETLTRIWSLCWYEAGEFEALTESAGLRVERTLDHGPHGCSQILA